MRCLLTILTVLCASATFAQQAKESVPPVSPGPREDPSRVIYELEVSPADEPRPAMKYRLLPNPADLKPGNAATQYYKAFVLEAQSPIRTEAYRKLEGWMETPLGELNLKEVGLALEQLNEPPFFTSIRAATFRRDCDWEEPVEDEGVALLLPALQSFRSVAKLLAMKAKYEIAKHDYHEAMLTGRDAFTLGYHLQRDGEILIQSLVGVAIVGMMHDEFFLEWIRSPGSPNLYAALAEIPPYYDSRGVIATELRFPEYTLPALKEIDRRAFTADEAIQLAKSALAIDSRRFSGSLKDDAARRVDLAAWALQAYDESYRELTASGFSAELLDQMPVLQVALLGRWQRYQAIRDDLYKWAALAYVVDRDLALRKQNEIHQVARKTAVPFDAFLPPLGATYQARLRQHRFLSVLRAIEALRLYAARHGKWPEALADVRDVPVPHDPVTNAPFVYQASDNNATLIMVEHRLSSGMEYEYRLRLRAEEKSK
ncbi:MAG TPA: hypothetical protein VJ809_13660 [Pirellulales bacterium]|jgi:hypothetical protein|nr:hypothetical protein [Pirellulales bacterium]